MTDRRYGGGVSCVKQTYGGLSLLCVPARTKATLTLSNQTIIVKFYIDTKKACPSCETGTPRGIMLIVYCLQVTGDK